MANDATATSGVSEDSDSVVQQHLDTDRMDLLDQLAESSHQTVLADVEEAIADGQLPTDDQDDGTVSETDGDGTVSETDGDGTVSETDGDEDEDLTPAATVDDDPLVTVKVDGVDTEVPLSQLKANYQKGSAADQRLEQAATERAELDRLQQQLHEEIEAAKLVVPEPPPTGDKVDKTAAQALATAMDDLSVGTEDEKIAAATTIKTLLGRGDNPAIPAGTVETTEEIVSRAAQQATTQMNYEMARAKFEQDYQDLAADPTLNQMVMDTLNQVAGESASYDEAFTKAVTKVTTWRDQVIANVTSIAPETTPKTSRADAKKTLTPEVKSAKSRATKPEETPETPADVVQQIRVARGQ